MNNISRVDERLTLQTSQCSTPPKKKRIENNVSVDEPETSQKATYVQIVTGNRIGNTIVLNDQNSDQNNEKAS